MPRNNTRIRRNIIWVFICVTLMLAVSLMTGMYQAWKSHLENQRLLLTRNASTVSTHVQTSLIDASKILDIARIRLESNLKTGALSAQKATQILSGTVSDFSLYNATDLFGLLFCTDAKGNLYAQNSGVIDGAINVSDRFYFKALEKHPYQRLIVGNLVLSKTNDRNAFHLAMPLQNRNGNFSGVIAQQILEDDLSSSLQHMMDHGEDKIYTYAVNRDISFVFPATALFDTSDRPDPNRLLEIIEAQKSTHGSMKINGELIGLSDNHYVGYAWSSYFGIYTIALVSEKSVFKDFLHKNTISISFTILGFLITGSLFFWLYQQALNLAKSEFISSHDALTGLNNRRGLDENFERLWRESMRVRKPISALFIDIDHFKQFNDKYGHDVGDTVLKAVASAIDQSLKRPLDFSCRWGGEEFVAVLPETDIPGAQMIAEKIMQAVRSISLVESGHALDEVTISIGIASLTVNAENLHDDLIGMADMAMLAAKNAGRNRVVIYTTGQTL